MKIYQHPSANRSAFTLIEILVVIAILAILATLLVPLIRSSLDTANNAKSISNLKTLHSAMATQASESGFWPSLNLENSRNPSQYGENSWYETLLRQNYIPVKRIRRDGHNILYSDSLVSPANKANQGMRFQWTSSPFPWTSSYAINRYWGERGSSINNIIHDKVRVIGGINNSSAILLIESLLRDSCLYPLPPNNHANWANSNCKIPRKDNGKGALALLANGSVISITPESHPDLLSRKYWDPRYIAP